VAWRLMQVVACELQDSHLYTCETSTVRGKEMAQSSDALKQMVRNGVLPSSSNVRAPCLPTSARSSALAACTHVPHCP
jgi:hypothetical protein